MKILFLQLLLWCAAMPIFAQQWDNYRSLLDDPNVKIDQTNLPIVFISVDGQTIQRDSRVLAHMKIIYNGDGQLNYGDTLAHPGQHVDYEGYIGIKYRGNTSFTSSRKKPYGLKTLKGANLEGKKDKVSILGMGKDNDWVLLAPYQDKTLMRDVLTYELARPLMRFTPHARFCEVILDGTYYGVFAFMERNTSGKTRLDLHDPGEDGGDLTGDYHVAVDKHDANEPYYPSRYRALNRIGGTEITNREIHYVYEDPDDFTDFPGAQEALGKEIDEMEASFRTENYTDSELGYRKYIDVESFIDYMLATELSMNIDGYRLSTHIYKHSKARAASEGIDPRWQAALWDFNYAWGNANYSEGFRTDVWAYDFNSREPGNEWLVPFYWYKMLQDPAYVAQMKERWAEARSSAYAEKRIYAQIDSIANLLQKEGAADRNFMAFNILGKQVEPNYYWGYTYQEDVDYMKRWIGNRLRWLDKMLLPRKEVQSESVGIMPESFNEDVVAESLPASASTTVGIDGNRAFYSVRVKTEGGLPTYGNVKSNATGVQYRLADYAKKNAVQVSGNGTRVYIKLTQPVQTDRLFMLATSGGGASTVKAVVHYTDGSSDNEQLLSIPDFSRRSPTGEEATLPMGNLRRDNDELSSDNHYYLFDIELSTDATKQVESISIEATSDALATIMALSKVVTTGIKGISADDTTASHSIIGIYTLEGMKLSTPQKGINIIKYSDGTSRKILI